MEESILLEKTYSAFINYLPNVLSFFILLFLGWAIGKIAGRIIEEIIKRSRIEKSVFKEIKPPITLSSFFSILVYLGVYLLFIQAAVEILEIKAIFEFISLVLSYIPKIFLFSIVMLVGYVVSEYLKKEIEKSEIELKNLISKVVFWLGMYVSLLISLPILGIRTFILEILFLIFVLSITLPFSVALTLVIKDELKKDIRKWIKKVRI